MSIAFGAPLLVLPYVGISLNQIGSGVVTLSIKANPNIKRDDGSPSHDGDVLSVQPFTGSMFPLQSRPAGAQGDYEQATVASGGLKYQPIKGGPSCLLPLQ